MPGNFDRNRQVGAPAYEKFDDRQTKVAGMRSRMENCSLPPDAVIINSRARIDVCSMLEEQSRRCEITELRGNV